MNEKRFFAFPKFQRIESLAINARQILESQKPVNKLYYDDKRSCRGQNRNVDFHATQIITRINWFLRKYDEEYIFASSQATLRNFPRNIQRGLLSLDRI